MTPEEQFIAAIIASPDDHTPKLMFADWLDEDGQDKLAAAYRWCGEKRKHPTFYPIYNEWSWFNKSRNPLDSPAMLPGFLFDRIAKHNKTGHYYELNSPTFNAAIQAIADHLEPVP